MIGWALAYLAGSYYLDVPARRKLAARMARSYADARGLPLLNVGAGTGKTALFGSTLYGDINTDLNGRKDIPHGTPGEVTYGDAQDLRDFPDGSIGAVLASHVLEHLPDPAKAIKEWVRVTGDPKAVFILTPYWWAPHTWLHPGHLWYFADGQGCTTGCEPKQLRSGPGALSKLTSLRGLPR